MSLFTLGTEHLEIFKFNHPLLGNRERVKRREWMVRQAGIKTERIRSGMYQLYYKHHSPIILRIDNIGWQAVLPSGSFANARTKAQCVILACMEIDKTEPIEEDLATGKYVSWWQDDPMFKTKEDEL